MKARPVGAASFLLSCLLLGCGGGEAPSASGPAKAPSVSPQGTPPPAPTQQAGSNPSGSGSKAGGSKGPSEGAACAYKSCDKCVGEAGCWWCRSSGTCSLGTPQSCSQKDL